MPNTKLRPEESIKLQTRSSRDIQKELSKEIAVLFTDMKESTVFYKTHGDLAGRIMVKKHDDMLFPIIKSHEGIIVKTIGDSIMAYFFAPYEALQAAIAIQKRLQAYNQNRGPNDHIMVRVVMNFGYGIIEEKDIFGEVVNIAGKLLSIAEANKILVSESFYHATKDEPNIPFSLYHPQEEKEHFKNLAIYEVDWEQTSIPNAPLIHLLSLKLKQTPNAKKIQKRADNILAQIKKTAYKTFTVGDTELFATFNSPHTCVETAKEVFQKFLQTPADPADTQTLITKIGIHSIHESEWNDEKALDFFSEATAARENAGLNEIVITSPFYNELTPTLKKDCSPLKKQPDLNSPLYILRWQSPETKKSAHSAMLPQEKTGIGVITCFYCGTKNHTAQKCPSKLIQYPTNNLTKIGYLPFKRIREVFHQNYARIVNPLKSGADEERFELLLKGNGADDDYSMSFFAFYEIKEHFQLCFLRKLWQINEDENDWRLIKKGNGSIKKEGKLWMGEDCLRVSRHKESEEWFEKAIKNSPNDYRPYVGLGILSIEEGQHIRALSYFNKSFFFPMGNMQKCYVYLLTARVYEIYNSLPQAIEEMEKIFALFPKWLDARYYYALLLAKARDTQKAIDILQKLIIDEPQYCLKMMIDPQMNFMSNEIQAIIDQLWKEVRYKGLLCLNRTKKMLTDYSQWFEKDDGEYKVALGLFQKASSLQEEESLFGILDIPGMEVEIDLQITNALNRRKKNLRENLFLFKKALERYSRFLELFPYKKFLTERDSRLQNYFRGLLDSTRQLVETGTPKSLKSAQTMLKKLSQATRSLQSAQEWLTIKMTIFFSIEFLLKTLGVFILIGASAALILTLVLTSYQGYEKSFGSINMNQLGNFLRFGLVGGSLSGLFATAIWIKKGFTRMSQKIKVVI